MAEDYRKAIAETLAAFKAFIRYERFPEIKITETKRLDDIWDKNDYWPGCAGGKWSVGLYFILDAAGTIIYIGKASNNSGLGIRLSTYFKTDTSVAGGWSLKNAGHKFKKLRPDGSVEFEPDTVTVVEVLGVDEAHTYEFSWIVPAMEEFFIKKLRPAANIIGNR